MGVFREEARSVPVSSFYARFHNNNVIPAASFFPISAVSDNATTITNPTTTNFVTHKVEVTWLLIGGRSFTFHVNCLKGPCYHSHFTMHCIKSPLCSLACQDLYSILLIFCVQPRLFLDLFLITCNIAICVWPCLLLYYAIGLSFTFCLCLDLTFCTLLTVLAKSTLINIPGVYFYFYYVSPNFLEATPSIALQIKTNNDR